MMQQLCSVPYTTYTYLLSYKASVENGKIKVKTALKNSSNLSTILEIDNVIQI